MGPYTTMYGSTLTKYDKYLSSQRMWFPVVTWTVSEPESRRIAWNLCIIRTPNYVLDLEFEPPECWITGLYQSLRGTEHCCQAIVRVTTVNLRYPVLEPVTGWEVRRKINVYMFSVAYFPLNIAFHELEWTRNMLSLIKHAENFNKCNERSVITNLTLKY